MALEHERKCALARAPAGPKFECLATNSIGGEPPNALLAVSDGEIFLRTDKQLWCIGETNKRRP